MEPAGAFILFDEHSFVRVSYQLIYHIIYEDKSFYIFVQRNKEK